MDSNTYQHIFNEVMRQAVNLIRVNQPVLASITIHSAFPQYDEHFFDVLSTKVNKSELDDVKELVLALY